jgi:hypothetical protein
MKINKETPTEISLEKSSTGTWTIPETSKRKIKPWQRLWLVSGMIYFLMLAGSFYLLVPNQERMERKMVFSITEEVKRFDGMAFAGESPRKIFETARSQGYATWIASVRSKYQIGTEGNASFARVDKEYRDAISRLPIKQNIGVIICFLAWLIPMSAFYAICSGVDWIKQGLRVTRL